MFDFSFLFNLMPWQYAAIAIEILVIGFWLYIGEECYHVVCDEPMAGQGYDPKFDNLFKCSVLFIFLVATLVRYSVPPNTILSPLGITIIASAIVCFVSFVFRSLFGWMS